MKTIIITMTRGENINETRISYTDLDSNIDFSFVVDNLQGERELQKWERKLGKLREETVNQYDNRIVYYTLTGCIWD